MDIEEENRGVARHERLHAPDFDHPLREAMDARAFWRNAVLSDPDAGFTIVGARGRFLAISENAAEMLLGASGRPLHGLSFFDLFPVGIAAERTAFYQHVILSERPLLVNSVWRGVRCRERWELLPGDARLAGQVLWMVRRTPIPWPAKFDLTLDVLDARENDWGPLSVLNQTERDALAHLAAGENNQELAKALHATPAEAAAMKRQIRRKLGVKTTAAMVRLALQAGLMTPANPEA
jgi:DNA-binding CsgD family transcriptional regulator